MTTINTYQTNGKDIIPTVIECTITDGIGIHVIGIIDTQTKEVLLRICTALQSLGYSIPGKKIIINIKPYSPSVGCIASVLDTAVALAILSESGKCQPAKNAFYVGELKLNGDSVYNETISKIENYHKANKPGIPLFVPGKDADEHPVYWFRNLSEAMYKKPERFFRKHLASLRTDVLDGIITILRKHKDDELDITDCGATPIIFEDSIDDNNSFTLDSISLTEDGKDIEVDASSCSSNWSGKSASLSLDVLAGILDFLEVNENVIFSHDE